MKYRAEIDGLRALAVLPVILFHAGFEWFSGGFVGVDVFFVISGYLITTIIISEIAEGKFSIVNFYERRARRILPALFFVMAICLPFAWFWMTPYDLEDFGQSLLAVSSFSSNIFFWLESGYFDTAAELKPLLHTWSLAVEEQYYILFPIFLMLAWQLGIKWILIILSLVFFISLGAAQWGSYHSPSANFFLLPTRGWELLVGVFAAFYLKYNAYLKSLLLNQALSLIGFGMIVYSIIVFDKTTPFPGLYALLPTFGTGLLILCAVPNTLIHKLLSLKFIVGIGLISYSAYLWHQPLLAFARHRLFGEISELILITLCLTSLVMAWLSWRFVEAPFRSNQGFPRSKIFTYSATGIAAFLILGIFFQFEAVLNKSPTNLHNAQFTSLGKKIEVIGEVCSDEHSISRGNFLYCEMGDKDSKKTILFFGDSHFQAIQYSLDRELRLRKIRGIRFRIPNCTSNIFTIETYKVNKKILECPSKFAEALEYFSDADYLTLISRWSMKYYFPSSDLGQPHFINKALGCEEMKSYREYTPFDSYGFKNPSHKSMTMAIESLLEVSSQKLKILLVYPVPEIACDPYKYNLNHRQNTGSELTSLSFPVEEYDKRNEFVVGIFDKFYEQNKNVILPIKLRSAFCARGGKQECVVVEDSVPLYIDDDHLSDAGADIVVEEIFKALEQGI
jgi:peptidoglycan/LPS O-acetylase OafA/YrhL